MREAERRGGDPEPGFYAIDAGALSIAELVHMQGLARLPLLLLAKGMLRPTGQIWLPRRQTEILCRPEDLSARFHDLTAAHRTALATLGFELCAAMRLPSED